MSEAYAKERCSCGAEIEALESCSALLHLTLKRWRASHHHVLSAPAPLVAPPAVPADGAGETRAGR